MHIFLYSCFMLDLALQDPASEIRNVPPSVPVPSLMGLRAKQRRGGETIQAGVGTVCRTMWPTSWKAKCARTLLRTLRSAGSGGEP